MELSWTEIAFMFSNNLLNRSKYDAEHNSKNILSESEAGFNLIF